MFWDGKHLVFFAAFNSLSEGIFNVPKQLGHTMYIMNSTLIEGSLLLHCAERSPFFFPFLLFIPNSFPLLSQLSHTSCLQQWWLELILEQNIHFALKNYVWFSIYYVVAIESNRLIYIRIIINDRERKIAILIIRSPCNFLKGATEHSRTHDLNCLNFYYSLNIIPNI